MRKLTILALTIFTAFALSACGGSNNGPETTAAQPGALNLPSTQKEAAPTDTPAPVMQEIPDRSNYPIIINGVGIADNSFTPEGEIFPTHVPFNIIFKLGLDAMSGGSQIAIQYDGELVAALTIINYLAGLEGFDITENDTFMTDDFEVYIPISLFKNIGFEVHFINGHVHINSAEGGISANPFHSPRTPAIGILSSPQRAFTEISVAINLGWSPEFEYLLWDERALTFEDAQMVHHILATMDATEILTPTHIESQQADTMFRIIIQYDDSSIETAYSVWGQDIFYRFTGTYGPHGDPGFVFGMSQALFDFLTAYF